MAWLSTWEKRRKITVSTANIDEDLTHFPVLLKLGTSVGLGTDDVSSIFTEVGANKLKLAITKTDGTTQIYAEIEKWDNANNIALIWVSKSDLVLAGAADTDLYIYYDNAQDDNTTYIGDDPDDAASNAVWNSNFLAVYHMNQASGTCKDSTGNNKDGTFAGDLPDVARAGQVGAAQDLDGTGDWVVIAIAGSSSITRECWYYADSLANYMGLLSRGGSSWTTGVCHIKGEATNSLTFDINYSSVSHKVTWGSLSVNNWFYLSCTYNATTGYQAIYGNGTERANATLSTGLSIAAVDYIGNEYDGARPANGIIDEVRFSDIARSAAWVKATYYTCLDQLVTWGDEETAVTTNSNTSSLRGRIKQTRTVYL